MFVKINHKLLWLHTICLALICFFSVKGYHATAWGTKDLNFGGTNLTHVNYANIAGEIKFIDTLKYYQKRLSELDATLSEDKKNSVKQLTKQFFNKHSYFAEVWKYLGNSQKNKISEGNYTVWKNSRYELNVFNTRKWCLLWKKWILQRLKTKGNERQWLRRNTTWKISQRLKL